MKNTRLADGLHALRDLDISSKVLGDASIDTERLVLGKVFRVVLLVETLSVTRVQELIEHGGDHVELCLCGSDLLFSGDLRLGAKAEEGHCCCGGVCGVVEIERGGL